MFAKTLSSLLIVAATGAGTVHAAETLNFGLISTESSANLRAGWEPVIQDLSRAIGVEVKPFFASDYAGVIEGMRFNKVQIAWYGNKSAIEAVDRAGGEVFARTTYANGDPGYWSVLVTAKDSPIASVEDVINNARNLSYGMGDPNSTSGYVVPNYYLWMSNRIDPKRDFKSARSANHEANMLAAMNRQVDIAITNTEALSKYNDTGKKWEDSLRIVWKSPIIPTDPIVYRKDLPDELKKKIQNFFFNYGKTDEEKARLAKLQFGRFEPSSDRQLIVIRQLDLATARGRLENDTSIPADEKRKRLAEIDGKLAEIARLADN